MSDAQTKIAITKDGPYLVSGSLPLSIETIAANDEGGSWEWQHGRDFDSQEKYALCRCGHSANKPFCDGSHKRVMFDGTETASRTPYLEQAETIDGPALELLDAENLCGFARFCDGFGSIWNIVEDADDDKARELAEHEATHCPSGRLVLRDKKTGAVIEPKLPPSIALIEDPAEGCSGPIWARGGIVVESSDGSSYEIRNRVTLCRCGASSNKPFCDGSHATSGFSDGL